MNLKNLAVAAAVVIAPVASIAAAADFHDHRYDLPRYERRIETFRVTYHLDGEGRFCAENRNHARRVADRVEGWGAHAHIDGDREVHFHMHGERSVVFYSHAEAHEFAEHVGR
ncbi:MAG TPA: hypothetical protein VF796_24615, partial [Humisphaera sp.]